MSFNVYAFLTCNGTDIPGDCTVESMGGDDVAEAMECFEVCWGVTTQAEGSSGARRGSRRMQDRPVQISKRLDGASPMLMQALVENQTIAGRFDFYDTAQDDGTTRKRYTIEIEGARIVDIDACSPDTLDPNVSSQPIRETVKFVFHTVVHTDHVASTEYRYEWGTAV
jgi:type VI secretion system secreted protein Hcp